MRTRVQIPTAGKCWVGVDPPVIPALRRQGQDHLNKLSRQTVQIEVLWVRVRAYLYIKRVHTCTHRYMLFVSLGICKLHASITFSSKRLPRFVHI